MDCEPHLLSFSSFIVDLRNETLSGGGRPIALRPKTFHVLRYLIAHRDGLVRTEELRRAVWSDTSVSGTVLRVCIRELREALSDDAEDPHFIQTIHGRGYRFIARVHDGTGCSTSAKSDLFKFRSGD